MSNGNHANIEIQLAILRNGERKTKRTSLPYETIDKNIIWLFSEITTPITHTEICLLLDLKYNSIKGRLNKMRKSQIFNEYVETESIGFFKNIYKSNIPKGTDIDIFTEKIICTIDKNKSFKSETIKEKLEKIGVEFQFDHMWQVVVNTVKNSGIDGITIDEIATKIINKNEKINNEIFSKLKKSIRSEIKRWKYNVLNNMVTCKTVYNKKYYSLPSLKNTSMDFIIESVIRGKYDLNINLQNLSSRNSIKEVHIRDTNRYVKKGMMVERKEIMF